MKTTQAQRNYITALITKIGVETALDAGAITLDMAVGQGRAGDADRAAGGRGFRSPRDVARHCNTKQTASKVIGALKALEA